MHSTVFGMALCEWSGSAEQVSLPFPLLMRNQAGRLDFSSSPLSDPCPFLPLHLTRVGNI